jgi:hypothetical protein
MADISGSVSPTTGAPASGRLARSLTTDGERSNAYVVGLAVLAVVGGFLFLIQAPVQTLLGDSAWAAVSGLHGLAAGVFMIGTTVGVYQAYRLYRGSALNIGEMQIGSTVTAATALITIMFGNWIYIAYRAKEGPRTYFLENAPAIHEIFFEFKEFIALFTLPIAVGVAFVIWYYGDQLRLRPALRNLLAVALVLVFFYFAVAFGLGAAITKLRAA